MAFIFPDLPHQLGLATTRQLKDAGASESALRHLARTGHRVHRTVYSKTPGPIPESSRIMAGWLWAGSASVLTGTHALVRHGLTIGRTPPLTPFIVPVTCRTRQRAAGVVTVRTARPPRTLTKDGVPIAGIERALVDAQTLRELSDRELKGYTIAILQQGRSTPDRLAKELELSRRTGTGGIVDGINAFRLGAWSPPEATLAEAVRSRAELPVMLANPRLLTKDGRLIGTPDGYFPDAGVVVQVHSQQYHDGIDEWGVDRWSTTFEKDLDYPRFDLVVVPIAPLTIIDRVTMFLDALVDVVVPRLGWSSDDIVVAP